jgi:hypothetical protein
MAMARDRNFTDEARTIGEPTEAPLDGNTVRALYADIIGGATTTAVLAYKELTGQK